jgi:hypothetical protein
VMSGRAAATLVSLEESGLLRKHGGGEKSPRDTDWHLFTLCYRSEVE